MTLRWFIASIHLVALAIGIAAVVARAGALRATREVADLPPVFRADNLWGIAALLWLGTGIWRAFGGLEKGTTYYLDHPLFHAKLGLFLTIFLLELRPMATLIKWRALRRRAEPVDLSPARILARISDVQAALVIVMVFLATAVARGIRP